MQNSTLTKEALEILQDFLQLPLPGDSVKCPYFTNERQRIRGGLRVQVGKGSAKEIVEEAELIAHKEKLDLANLDQESKTKFLVDHNLGIDCSGLVFYILDAESRARGAGALANKLNFPRPSNVLSLIRSIMIKRPVENTSVAIFADAKNSKQVEWREAKAGDFIVINKYARQAGSLRNHILVITKVEDGKIWAAQSVALPEDGRYAHGVRIEQVDPTNSPGPLHRLNWF